MKHFLLFITLLAGGLSFGQGQGDVTVYSNTGDKFYVILNGVRQNDQPQTNVKVTGLTNPYYSCKIISANNNFQIEKNVIVKSDTLITYQILEKKGKYKLRFYTETSLGTSTAQKDQTIVAYHATENVAPTATTGTTGTGGTTGTSSTVTTTTTGTTSTVETTGNTRPTGTNTVTEGINMNISINENGMSTNVNVTGTENGNMNTNMNTTGNTTATSTTTGGYQETVTTTSTTTNNGNTTSYYEETTVTSSSTGGNVNQGNIFESSGDVGGTNGSCYFSDTEATELASQVENESFPDDQQRVANLAAKNKCMTTAQIKKVAAKFNFDDNRLSFMKTAYDNCTDQSNYYKLMDSFVHSSDKEELQKFIDSKR